MSKKKRADYRRWVFFNPKTEVFIETMPTGPNLVGMSGGMSLARALMFISEAEANSWLKDVQELNPDFKVTRVILELNN